SPHLPTLARRPAGASRRVVFSVAPTKRETTMVTNRLELPVVAEAPAATSAKSKTTRARKPKTAPAAKPAAETLSAAKANPAVVRWATFGVIFTLILSAALNGLANAQHAPVAWAGWLMGLAIPVLVLVLAKVTGEKFRGGQRTVAWFAGGSGVALLF